MVAPAFLLALSRVLLGLLFALGVVAMENSSAEAASVHQISEPDQAALTYDSHARITLNHHDASTHPWLHPVDMSRFSVMPGSSVGGYIYDPSAILVAPNGLVDDVVGLSDDYIDITAKGSRVRNVQTSVGRSGFEQELADSGFSRSVLTTNKNVVQYELDGARYVVRDAATSTGGPTADFYPAGSDAFTLKIRLGGS